MSFRRTLIAVHNGPVAAHAADVDGELARSLGASLAFIHAIDPSLNMATQRLLNGMGRLSQRQMRVGYHGSLPAVICSQ